MEYIELFVDSGTKQSVDGCLGYFQSVKLGCLFNKDWATWIIARVEVGQGQSNQSVFTIKSLHVNGSSTHLYKMRLIRITP